MPKRTDIESILVIGAGPIVIGQACEFDYSGTQACKALRGEGYRVILVNSNPATIMTDPDMADRTYIEPLVPEVVEEILRAERPDAILPTLGGQTALNLALELHDSGVLDELGVEMLGAGPRSIRLAEDREQFKDLVAGLGLESPKSGFARSMDDARQIVARTGFPCVLRPSFTLGGVGGGVVEDEAEFEERVRWALELSPVGEVLIDESLIGWKEFEMEVVRDSADRCIIICAIENLDPMGVHTGDSITVAPSLTLSDREYQKMRDASMAIIRAVGVATGGSNIQFAVDPATGRQVVIEMNPRVSRSSALASKATGFPIAKIAALLAVGYLLDELPNDITQTTSACFEPTLDYVVTKMPRFAFEKFPQSPDELTTQMKSVGEVMAIGRTFGESLCKALRSMEGGSGTLLPHPSITAMDDEALVAALAERRTDRLMLTIEAMRRGRALEEIIAQTAYEPWFLYEIEDLLAIERQLAEEGISGGLLEEAKRAGLADRHIASMLGVDEDAVRQQRWEAGLHPVYKRVDTCAAEFEAQTPYLYSTYEEECESEPDTQPRVLILGSGPNRIGQGIEFDYSCVKCAQTVQQAGQLAVMLNCNPETVSTDHDISDRLYFEPIDLEAVLEVVRLEQPHGVVVQLGGQTPLRLARGLEAQGVPILGTPPAAIDRAEDREAFGAFAQKLGLQLPRHETARTPEEARQAAEALGFPVMVRPSHVLGGRAMAVLHDAGELEHYLAGFFDGAVDERSLPLLFDEFLEGALELDIDAVSDGERVVIGGIMEQVEPTGVHSGDSACLLPAPSVSPAMDAALRQMTRTIALELGVVGLLNVQLALTGDDPEADIWVIEVNPRASRTVPFVSKATGTCLATLATQVMLGQSLEAQGQTEDLVPFGHFCKEVVLPLSRFPGSTPVLRPEMRSTGEVMARGEDAWQAYARAQQAASNEPVPGAKGLWLDVDPRERGKLEGLREVLSHLELSAPREQADALADVLRLEVQPREAGPEGWEEGLCAALFLHRFQPGPDRPLAQRFREVQAAGLPYFSTAQALQAWWRGQGVGPWAVRAIQDR